MRAEPTVLCIRCAPIAVGVVTLLVTPTDAEKLTLASREGTLRLAMRNYSDSKIIATNGVAMIDLMHNGAAPVPLMQPQPIAGSPRPAHLNADGRTPLRVEVMRDGKSSEAISFLNSGKLHRSYDQTHDSTPPIAVAPAPFHSLKPRPQRVLKIMMLAMCSVQLEKPYFPIWVSPMV